jgi:hypothetical protein
LFGDLFVDLVSLDRFKLGLNRRRQAGRSKWSDKWTR